MLLRGARTIDPTLGLDARADVRVRGNVIAEIGEHLFADESEPVIDFEGACIAPGFIDMHVHLREPGNPQKETLRSGSAAALAGGFTAVACMPNTEPPLDTPERIANLRRKAAASATARIYPVGTITQGRCGKALVDFSALAKAGAVAFSDDGETVTDPALMRHGAQRALAVEGCIIAHCEDPRLKANGVMHAGRVSQELRVAGSPAQAEASIVARDVRIARETGKAWHIAHVSTIGAIEELRAAHQAGIRVSGEATPHHLVFTDEAVREKGAAAKVNPPLRPAEHVRALRDAVRDGTIEVFASDHAPHEEWEKQGPLADACVGFTGLEVAVGAYAYALPDLPLSRFVSLLSSNPARILNVPGGTLRPGSVADITVFADRPWRVEPNRFQSKGRSTPFAGMVLPRRAIAVIVGGALVMPA